MITTVKDIKEILNLHHGDDEVFISNPSGDNSVYTMSPANHQIAMMMILHKEHPTSRIDIYTNPPSKTLNPKRY